MGLEALRLVNFRLFDELEIRPDPEAVTVFLSANGTGKTSVLEAVHTLATAASFRTTSAADMIKTGEMVAEVHGTLTHLSRRLDIDFTATRTSRAAVKRMLVNGQRPRSRGDLAAVLPITVFTPEGVDIIRQSPEGRRSFLSSLVCDVNPLEGEIVERFERLLRQRNATLRSWRGVSPSPNQRAELAIWSDDLAQAVEPLVESRERLLSDLEPGVGRHYEHLAERQERISVSYERSWDGPFREALERSLDDDVARGFTTIGPHRDDMVVTLNGRDARRQASQGEQRSLALALRLAGHELVSTARHISPLLLLDDVFSELDPLRSERLLTLLPVGQTLVTTATPLPAGMSPAVIFDLATLIS